MYEVLTWSNRNLVLSRYFVIPSTFNFAACTKTFGLMHDTCARRVYVSEGRGKSQPQLARHHTPHQNPCVSFRRCLQAACGRIRQSSCSQAPHAECHIAT